MSTIWVRLENNQYKDWLDLKQEFLLRKETIPIYSLFAVNCSLIDYLVHYLHTMGWLSYIPWMKAVDSKRYFCNLGSFYYSPCIGLISTILMQCDYHYLAHSMFASRNVQYDVFCRHCWHLLYFWLRLFNL